MYFSFWELGYMYVSFVGWWADVFSSCRGLDMCIWFWLGVWVCVVFIWGVLGTYIYIYILYNV